MNHDHQTTATSVKPAVMEIAWDAPIFSSMMPLPSSAGVETRYRLFQVTEIGENKAVAYRLAMANVLSGLDDPQCQAVYILSGTPTGVQLYVGIASTSRSNHELHDMAETLKASFEGNFLGAGLVNISRGNVAVEEMMSSVKHLGLISGIPSFNEDESQAGDEDFQGIERLANSLVGETWQLVVVGEPGTDDEIRETLDRIYDFSTEISSRQKQSVQRSENSGWSLTATKGTSVSDTHGTSKSDTRGRSDSGTETKGNSKSSNSSSSSSGTSDSQAKTLGSNTSTTTGASDSKALGTSDSKAEGKSGGASLAYTSERVDKRVEEIQRHISENLIPRFQQGRSKGMFRTSVYVCAKEKSTYERLTRSVLSIFQGNESTMTPLRVDKLTHLAKGIPFKVRQYSRPDTDSRRELVYSVPSQAGTRNVTGATWLTTREFALIAGLPSKELPGIKIRKSVDFALNTATTHADAAQSVTLGNIVQHGRVLPNSKVLLPKVDLSKHVFVTGVTGAGKTTTCMKLLLESGMPFMVIEPAKTEYRALHAQKEGKDIEYYVLGREDLTPFRLNPFELVSPRENLSGHISILNATLGAVFPMEAAMPYIVEEAIIKAYKEKGWDIHAGKNYYVDDPWAHGSSAWPTFADMIAQLEGVITSKGMGKEFEEKYLGSLVGRLTNLTLGTKGRMLNTRYSLDFDQLLDKKVVIELEELKDEQDKALFMGLILTRLAECMKHRHRSQPGFRHLTLIEEAHRLLSRSEPGDPGSKKLGVETFANLLAEVRKYGEGLVIADQIPNKLVSDVIKNTHTKIVHRLFSADDRNTIGDAMGLTDEQKDFLPLLQAGETIVYCGGWHAPVRVQVEQGAQTDQEDIPEELIRDKGMQQLWAQRRRLYPELSSRPEMTDANVLSSFSSRGTELINMMLTIKNNIHDGKRAEHVARFASRYAKNYQALADDKSMSAAVVAQLLKALFFDVTGMECSDSTKVLLMGVLPAAFESLACDVITFKAYIETREGRRIFHEKNGDPQFKKLESV